MRTAILVSALLITLLPLAPAAADTLDDALERAGTTRAELGFRPREHWMRFPRDIPGKLGFFDDLFAEPLATVPFVRAFGRAVREHLGPEGLAKEEREAHSVYRLVHAIGVAPRFGGFRAYSPNLLAKETPLADAVLALYRDAGRQTRFVTFATESPYPLVEKDLRAAAAKLPDGISRVLGQLVLNLLDARRWAELAFRNVPLEDRIAVARRLDLAMESTDALEFCPEADDVARTWDEASLWYAGLKCVEALDTARRKLAALEAPPDAAFAWRTPLGWIRVTGPGADEIDARDALLLVDLGGDDRYEGPAGASDALRPIGLCLDLGGNDAYRGGAVAQGAGVCGVGVLLDAAGDDAYVVEEAGQGFGQFGLGALIDLSGADETRAGVSAQGVGVHGIGLLLDAAGNDKRHLRADGQGFGSVAGVGVLADRAGDDEYVAEPDAAKSGRPSYHSDLKVSVSNAQGCAMGRRGDGADGHSWAGGLGMLLDAEGRDVYRSGNWSQGTGYWFGTGLLWDGAGDDRYEGVVWSQATGAHFCIGALVDDAGDDRYRATQWNSIAFGHDFTIALLVDGAGNDRYETPGDGLGFSINRSFAMLLDLAGDDVYRAKSAPGTARYDKRFADREALSNYWVDATSLGLFLDLGGKDDYGETDRNGTTWGDGPGTDNRRVRNPGAGADVEGGSVDFRGRSR